MIIEKPWGYEELIEKNDKYVVKKLFMKAGNSCSLQYHKEKHETFYLISGEMLFQFGEDENNLTSEKLCSGTHRVIKPGFIHRMSAITDILYLEASTPQLDDVVRLKDMYGR